LSSPVKENPTALSNNKKGEGSVGVRGLLLRVEKEEKHPASKKGVESDKREGGGTRSPSAMATGGGERTGFLRRKGD